MATLTNVISNSTGNVGIGTTSTATKLQVYSTTGTAQIFNQLQLTNMGGGNNGDIVGIGFAAGESTQYGVKGSIGFVRTTSYGRGDITFYTNNTAGTETVSTSNERMRIAADGNVGIGTTSPGAKLQINNASDSRLIIYETGTAPYTATLELSSQVLGTYGATVQYTSDTEKLTIQNYGRSFASSTGGGILFKTKLNNTTATDVMVINGFSGNVGIGTTAPASKLHISGSGQTIMRLDSSTTTNISQYMVKANTDGVLIMGMSGGSAASTNFGVTAAGQAYIGTTTLSTIHPTSLVIGTASPIAIIFSTNSTQKARITSDGSLLVGTTVQAANTAGTAVATNFKGINAYEFNDTTGRGSTQGISWNYLINTTHIIDISPGDTLIAYIDVRLAAYSSSGSGYANSLFCYGGHVGAYNITTVFNVNNGNVTVSAAIVSSKLRITITIANTGLGGECVLTVTDANKNGTLSTIVRS